MGYSGGGIYNGALYAKSGATDYGTTAGAGEGTCIPLGFDANRYNTIYTNNGKVLPLSISKQSFIIYK